MIKIFLWPSIITAYFVGMFTFATDEALFWKIIAIFIFGLSIFAALSPKLWWIGILVQVILSTIIFIYLKMHRYY